MPIGPHEHVATFFPDLPLPPESPASRVRSGRSANRAAAWQSDLARGHAYLLGQARTDDERGAADRLYNDALTAGPDFARVRSGSDFREPPVNKIDRNAFTRIMHALEMIERGTYRHGRVPGKQGMPRTTARVLKALLGLAMRHGRVYPSLRGLAALACVAKQTVVNGLKLLATYGFVVVHRRRKRVRTPLGVKQVQETNAYTVQDPVGMGAMALSVFKAAGSGPASESRSQAASIPTVIPKRGGAVLAVKRNNPEDVPRG